MQNNNPNDYLKEDEIDLNEIFKLLINSKKLIITLTLVITTLGSIYAYKQAPQYRTTALMEIGNYYDLAGSNQMLIEPAKTLIQELTINFIHKQKAVSPCLSKLTLNSLEDRLLTLKCESPFSEKNKESLNELATFIENRHLNLQSNNIKRITSKLTYEIQTLNNQIEFSNSSLLTQNEDDKLRISNEIESLNDQIEYINNALLTQNKREKLIIANEIEKINSELPTIDTKTNSLNEIIIADKANLLLLKSDP